MVTQVAHRPGESGRFVEPIRWARAYELAVEHTVDGIERRRLGPGARLPNVSELAFELDVSAPTVRQALHVLEASDVIAVRRGGGGGIYVISELIPAYAISTHVPDDEGLVDAVTARRVIEGAVTERATTCATDDDLEAIARTVELMSEHIGLPDLVNRADAMFHRAVVRAAHSRTLERSMREVERLLAPIRHEYPPAAEEHRRTLDIHGQQLEAMRARDIDAVRRVCDEHFRILEETIARRRGHTWERLFGPVLAQRTE
jgi:GntR family transcriptional repressor for pyruvate dehydrogenase complex